MTDMEMTFEMKLHDLSERSRKHVRSGQIGLYCRDLKEMAQLFQQEKRYSDQMKMLCLAFYIDLSGLGRAPYIDRAAVEQLQTAASEAAVTLNELERFYFTLIQPDLVAQHTMSVKDSWYLLRLCLEGKMEQAEWALSKV